MWQQTLKPIVFSYWQTLFRLHKGKSELEKMLDLPLETAISRAWSTIAWTVAWLTVAMASFKSLALAGVVSHLGLWAIVAIPLALTAAIVLSYGLFRLYVLVSHVIAINIFKSRGQRLRWLNQWTAILTLSFPAAIAFTVVHQMRWVGLVLGTAVCIYGLFLGTWACKLVFHKTTWRGLGFLLGLNTVTSFILATCCIAALAALFILGFVVLLIARVFYT